MQLSKRLEAIASMVTPGNRLVDVGCDHGYLPIALVRRQIIPSAIAMDVRSGPLGRAKENIEAYGLNPYIETRLSDGLEALQPGEGDTLSVAGMGGPLIERILSRNVEVSHSQRSEISVDIWWSAALQFPRRIWCGKMASSIPSSKLFSKKLRTKTGIQT